MAIEENQDINWDEMMNLIHLTAIERSLKSQYLNASNISARIRLHPFHQPGRLISFGYKTV